MKAISIIAVFLVLNTKNTFAKCPTESISLCECFPETHDIICDGNDIKELNLKSLQKYDYGTLWINNTAIKNIVDESLGNSTWSKIYIHNNKDLISISANAFKKGPESDLWIKNNRKLNSNSLHDLLQNLIETKYIRLDDNDIILLKPKLLNPESKIIYFDAHSNILRSVKPETFVGPKNLSYIRLDKNSIDHIYPNSFKFEAGENKNRTITVLLDDNHLNSSSFNKDWFIDSPNLTIELSLRYNNITQLKQDVFDPFLSNKKNKLFFGNNDFNCDCNMKWLLNGDYREDNTYEVGCYEQRESLFKLNSSDLLCTTTPTNVTTIITTMATTTTTTTIPTSNSTSNTTKIPA